MNKASVSLPVETVSKIARLADLLGQAHVVAAEIARSAEANLAIPVPKLNKPDVIPSDQAWFWSDDWQAMEHEANEDIRAGRYKTFDTVEELLTDLQAHV